MKKWCGLIAGYPAGLSLQRWKGDGKETLGAFFWIDMPVCPSPLVGGLRPGVTMKTQWAFPPDLDKALSHYYINGGWGWSNPFDKPWAEVVREGGPHCPNGVLEVEVTVQLATKE